MVMSSGCPRAPAAVIVSFVQVLPRSGRCPMCPSSSTRQNTQLFTKRLPISTIQGAPAENGEMVIRDRSVLTRYELNSQPFLSSLSCFQTSTLLLPPRQLVVGSISLSRHASLAVAPPPSSSAPRCRKNLTDSEMAEMMTLSFRP